MDQTTLALLRARVKAIKTTDKYLYNGEAMQDEVISTPPYIHLFLCPGIHEAVITKKSLHCKTVSQISDLPEPLV